LVLNGSSGGTIDMIVSPEGAHFLSNGKSSMLAHGQENLATHRNFSMFKQPVDSSNIDRAHQAELTTTIVNKMNTVSHSSGKVAGMVLTQGTDTLMETAALLSYQRPNIPIVLTGAWVSAGKPGSDAIQNIQRAKQLASTLHVPGVFVVIGNDIHLGSRVNKVRSGPLSPSKSYQSTTVQKDRFTLQPYFVSLDGQPIGHFNQQGRIVLDHDQLSRLESLHAQQSDCLKRQTEIPIKPAFVEHLVVNSQTPFKVFEDLFKRLETKQKPNGAVLEGTLERHPDRAKIFDLLTHARKQGMYGITTLTSQSKTEPFNVSDIPPVHLRAKLAALLGSQQEDVIKQLSQFLHQNLTGERIGTELAKKTWFKLPCDSRTQQEVLVITPSFSSCEIQDATKRLLDSSKKLSIDPPKLLLVGFGDGHVPIGSLTLEERVLSYIPPNLAKSIQKVMQSKTGIEADWTIVNVHSALTTLLGNSNEAKEQLQKALAKSHPNLIAIDYALNQGIDVRMDTKVTNSPATLKSYEIGTILDYLGVKPV
jgi:Asparaginase, N-terminal